MTRECFTVQAFREQKAKIEALLQKFVENTTWYIIDFRWWSKWNKFIELAITEENLEAAADDFPGQVDNTNLLRNGELKPNLLMEEDITVIPEEAWKIFVDYYGCVHEDVSVFRRVAVKTPMGRVTIEIYPPCITFLDVQSKKTLFAGKFSETQTIGDLKEIVRKKLPGNRQEKVHLFVLDESGYEELTDDDVTIGEASIEREKFLYVRFETADFISSPGKNVLNCTSGRSAGSVYSSSSILGLGSPETKHVPGVCGLSNLGNTCFMNSALQCISNVPELTHYFTKQPWKQDINKVNPLGTRGRIAVAYAELISHMWSGLYSCDVPRTLKYEIAMIASQFHGYAQHDSHELLVFLLDGLHEDLNRVKNKPYIEFKDADGRPDSVVADEAWHNHLARNDSIIVDLFHGQLKSTVICPTCNYKSLTFDPFASLNLPLPETSKYLRTVYVWPWKRSKQTVGPILLKVAIHPNFYVRDILNLLEQIRPPHTGCRYRLTEVYNKSASKVWDSCYQVRELYGPPLFAYELPPGVLIPVSLQDPREYNTSGRVGIPFFISIPHASESEVTEPLLIDLIASRLRAIGIDDDLASVDPGSPNASVDQLDAIGSKRAGDRSKRVNHNVSMDASEASSDADDSNDAICPDTGTNGDDAFTRFLQGRIGLADGKKQINIANDCSVDLRLFYVPLCRITIECSGATWWTKLDDTMNAITRPTDLVQPANSKQTATLLQCLEKFISVEKLGTRDLWYCPKCKEEKQATKKFDLWSLPRILVIQLKRFRSGLRSRDKIDMLVDFPIRGLDLTQWVTQQSSESFIYDLIAVSNHMGSLGGGHYTAYAINQPTKQWYIFDDASTRKVSESNIVTRAAYVLVYRRRTGTADEQPDLNNSQSNTNHIIDDLYDDESSPIGPTRFSSSYTNDDDLNSVE